MNECVKRVPEDVDAMKHLLKYGFLGTHIKIIQAIATDSNIPFVYIEENNEDEENKESKEAEELSDILTSLDLTKYIFFALIFNQF